MKAEWKDVVISAVPLSVDFNLACVGTSISGLSAMTLESIGYIVSADIVYAYPVSSAHALYLRGLNDNIVDLNQSHYAVGQERVHAYENIINLILADLRRGERVCYAQQGSCAFLAYSGTKLRRIAAREGFRVVAIPGVSSFECLLTHLSVRHDLYDLQLFNCGTVMQTSELSNPRRALFLFNLVTYAGERVVREASTLSIDHLRVLAERLSAHYGPEHPAHLLSVLPSGRVKEVVGPVARLASLLLTEPACTSLFLPPLLDSRGT